MILSTKSEAGLMQSFNFIDSPFWYFSKVQGQERNNLIAKSIFLKNNLNAKCKTVQKKKLLTFHCEHNH